MESEGKSFVPVSPAAVCKWLTRFFGKGSPDHTTVAPRKTDACSECEQLKGDIDSLKASLARHLLQEGNMSIERQQEIEQIKDDIKDCGESVRVHRAAADSAMAAYKDTISGSYERYRDMEALFDAAVAKAGEEGVTREERLELAASFSKEAAGYTLNLSSDY